MFIDTHGEDAALDKDAVVTILNSNSSYRVLRNHILLHPGSICARDIIEYAFKTQFTENSTAHLIHEVRKAMETEDELDADDQKEYILNDLEAVLKEHFNDGGYLSDRLHEKGEPTVKKGRLARCCGEYGIDVDQLLEKYDSVSPDFTWSADQLREAFCMAFSCLDTTIKLK